jgi:phosphomannomutase
MVRASGADLGVAIDGDADRCLAADAEGNMVNGDQNHGHSRPCQEARGQAQPTTTLVVTVMSNLGLKLALKEMGYRHRADERRRSVCARGDAAPATTAWAANSPAM